MCLYDTRNEAEALLRFTTYTKRPRNGNSNGSRKHLLGCSRSVPNGELYAGGYNRPRRGTLRPVRWIKKSAGGDEHLRARVENVGFDFFNIEAVLGIVEAAIRDPLRNFLAGSQVTVGPNFHAFATESAMRNDRCFGTLRIAS